MRGTLSPTWQKFQLSTNAIEGIDSYFLVQCYRWNKDGAHELIGAARTTLREFTLGAAQLALQSPEKVLKKKTAKSGKKAFKEKGYEVRAHCY